MRVALDAQLTVGTATGIGEYVRGLAASLRSHGIDAVELTNPALDPWRFPNRVLWDQVQLPQRAVRSGAALLHCASGTMPIRHALPTVVTVHDVAWSRVQQHAPWYARRYFGAFALARYRRAAAVITDSPFSRSELLAVARELDPQRVVVVAPGVDPAFAAVTRRPDGRTLLAVGTVEPRKNLAFAVELLRDLPDARLVSVGPTTPYAQQCVQRARELGVVDRFSVLGYVPRSTLLGLYATAAAAVVPSVYEGFGYGVAQALCSGLPCAASDEASLPDVGGGDAEIVPLRDRQAWLGYLSAALRGERDAAAGAVRARSIARFSWERAGQETAAIYDRAVRQ